MKIDCVKLGCVSFDYDIYYILRFCISVWGDGRRADRCIIIGKERIEDSCSRY